MEKSVPLWQNRLSSFEQLNLHSEQQNPKLTERSTHATFEDVTKKWALTDRPLWMRKQKTLVV